MRVFVVGAITHTVFSKVLAEQGPGHRRIILGMSLLQTRNTHVSLGLTRRDSSRLDLATDQQRPAQDVWRCRQRQWLVAVSAVLFFAKQLKTATHTQGLGL
jgi:hypothetical protein